MTGALRRGGGGAPTLLLATGLATGLASTALAQDGPSMPDAPQAQEQSQPAKATSAQILGTVIDGDADIVPGAQVTLTLDGTNDVRKTASDDNGVFRFTGLPEGKFTLKAAYPGMASATVIGVLHAGESVQTLPIKLGVSASESVQVVATQEELAAAELKVEETQRLAGIMPNFFVTYDWHAAPLTSKQKFNLSFRSAFDPVTFAITGATAGVQQAENVFAGYGQGAAGYGKRFAANTGDVLSGTFMGGYVFPVLLHQDPRYFYKGTGTVWARAKYAVAAAFICRGDNGKWQPNYSGVLGDLSAGAISNLYYPASDRNGAALTIENGFLGIGEDAIGNLVQEFVFRHLTPHAPTYASTTNPSAKRATAAPSAPTGTIQP